MVLSDGNAPLNASHETFGAKKLTLVLSGVGNGVEIEDIHDFTQKP